MLVSRLFGHLIGDLVILVGDFVILVGDFDILVGDFVIWSVILSFGARMTVSHGLNQHCVPMPRVSGGGVVSANLELGRL